MRVLTVAFSVLPVGLFVALAGCSSSPSPSPSGPSDASSRTDVTHDASPATDTSESPDVPVAPGPTPVTTFQFDPQRTGANHTETVLTPAVLMSGRFGRDTAFGPTLDGDVYAQPLYLPHRSIHGGTHDVVYVVTQANSVFALDASTGTTLWTRSLGTPVPRTSQPCGNISPTTGILGTPVIDLATSTLYAVAYTSTPTANVFVLHALDVDAATERTGFPVPVHPPDANGSSFDPVPQGERGALALIDNRLYVPFGGLDGDCANYHGWVVGIDPSHPTAQVSFGTPGRGAGIWAPGGASTDGTGHLFLTTGNAFGPRNSTPPPLGEYVFRFAGGSTGPTWSGSTMDYFTPSNAAALDAADLDIGSNSPVVLPVTSGRRFLSQGSKSGVVYLLDASNLGGVGHGDGNTGEGAFSQHLFTQGIYGAMGAWSDGTNTFLFVPGRGARVPSCGAVGTGGTMALRVTVTVGSPSYTVAWCTASADNPNPPAVSSNGNADAILWALGTPTAAMPTGTFNAYSLPDGTRVYTATGTDIPAVRQWVPPVIADGRVFITGPSSLQMYRVLH